MYKIDRYLRIAASRKASDLHFSAGEPVRMRADGDLEIVEPERLETDALQDILFEILTPQEREKCLNTKNLDKSYALEGVGYFRVNIFFTRRGIASVLRTIPQRIPTMADLGLPWAVKMLAESPKGLVLVTGPTGSGKSTTLAAMINHINTNFPYHILTAEDPVEFVHESKKCLINQREIGASCQTFADALKFALREDPDVILVGEMRDLETIGLALTAAETGHLVFGTLHTRGAGASVDRIIDSFPANQQAMIRTMLAESLVGVVSQSLLKRCDKSGRVAALEILVVNHAISNLIREGKTFQMASVMQTGRKEGMLLMDQHILELVDKGIVHPDEAESYMEEPAPLMSRKAMLKEDPAGFQRKVAAALAADSKAANTPAPAATPAAQVATPPAAPPTAPISTAAPKAPVPPPAPGPRPVAPPPPPVKAVPTETPASKVISAASQDENTNSTPVLPLDDLSDDVAEDLLELSVPEEVEDVAEPSIQADTNVSQEIPRPPVVTKKAVPRPPAPVTADSPASKPAPVPEPSNVEPPKAPPILKPVPPPPANPAAAAPAPPAPPVAARRPPPPPPPPMKKKAG